MSFDPGIVTLLEGESFYYTIISFFCTTLFIQSLAALECFVVKESMAFFPMHHL